MQYLAHLQIKIVLPLVKSDHESSVVHTIFNFWRDLWNMIYSTCIFIPPTYFSSSPLTSGEFSQRWHPFSSLPASHAQYNKRHRHQSPIKNSLQIPIHLMWYRWVFPRVLVFQPGMDSRCIGPSWSSCNWVATNGHLLRIENFPEHTFEANDSDLCYCVRIETPVGHRYLKWTTTYVSIFFSHLHSTMAFEMFCFGYIYHIHILSLLDMAIKDK